jgi:pimeloyl-ACP methyl ester carboxylesterase
VKHVVACVLVAALLATAAASAAQPPLRLQERCLTKKDKRHPFRFTGSDGVRLVGLLVGRGTNAVVLGNEGGATLCGWLRYAKRLSGRGFRVLVFDFRWTGSSSHSPSTNADEADRDVIGAVTALRARGMRTIQLMGASFGAGASLAAAPQIAPPVDSVVSLSSPLSMGPIVPEDGARRSTAPVLFAAAEDDPPFADDARAMYAESPAADKRLAVVPAGGHGTSLVGPRRPLDALVESYLREHAG